MYDLNFILVYIFIQKDDSFVIPYFYAAILTTGGDKAKIMTVGAAGQIFLVGLWLSSLDTLARSHMSNHLVHVHLDGTIPATGYNCMIVAAITDE